MRPTCAFCDQPSVYTTPAGTRLCTDCHADALSVAMVNGPDGTDTGVYSPATGLQTRDQLIQKIRNDEDHRRADLVRNMERPRFRR
jgi:hypothetical protein